MSFQAMISGHMKGTEEEAKKLEEDFTNRITEVVKEFKDHVETARVSGQHVTEDIKAAVDAQTGTAMAQPDETSTPAS